jgi:hypothetical protein
MALGAALFFGLALIVLTRPVPALKIDKFLVVVMVRIILRRYRKRILLKLHLKERDDPRFHITRDASFTYNKLLKEGKIDKVVAMRQSMHGAMSLGLALQTVGNTLQQSGIVSHDALSHLAEQSAHVAGTGIDELGREILGEEDVDNEHIFDVVGNMHERMEEGGGAPDVGNAVADGAEQAAEAARNAAAEARRAAAGAQGTLKSIATTVQTEGGRVIAQIRSAVDPGMIKILMGNLQINASLMVVFEIPWPPLHKQFLGYMSVFKLDVFKGLSFAAPCLHSSHYMSLASFIATPLVLLSVFFTAFVFVSMIWGAAHLMPPCCRQCLRKLPCGRYTVSSARIAAVKVSIILILFIYPTICSKVFMTFKCVDVGDSGWYMFADMSVQCYHTEWWYWAVFASFGMVVYIVGIPVILVSLLYLGERKGTLQYPPTELSSTAVIHAVEVQEHVGKTNQFFNNRLAFGNLYLQYTPKYWWFEFFCTMRKMILTGALVLFGAGTSQQVITALIVCVIWYGLIANLHPFGEATDNRLAQVEGLQVLFTLMIGLVLQLQRERAKSGDAGEVNSEILGVTLIVLNVAVVGLAILQQPIVFNSLGGCFCAAPRHCRAECRDKRAWAKVVLAAPTDEDYAVGASDAYDWCDSHTFQILPVRPRALVTPAMASQQHKAKQRRKSGLWGKEERWHFDAKTGEAINSFIHAVADDGRDVWLEADGRIFYTAPLELMEAACFSESTHWVDLDNDRLLDGRPALVEAPLSPVCCIARHQNGEFANMWRNHFTNELRETDPALEREARKRAAKARKKGCCGKAPRTAPDSDIDGGIVTVDAEIETPYSESAAEQKMKEELIRQSIKLVASAHVATTEAKSTADAYLAQHHVGSSAPDLPTPSANHDALAAGAAAAARADEIERSFPPTLREDTAAAAFEAGTAALDALEIEEANAAERNQHILDDRLARRRNTKLAADASAVLRQAFRER